MAVIRVVQVGLGPLGQIIARHLLERRQEFRVVGAVDIDPGKVGKDLGEICRLGKKLGVPVRDNMQDALRRVRADVALLTTVSDMKRISPQVETIVGCGLHVVSTCEEMCYPWATAKRLALRIDRAAKERDVAVLSVGVNPGFLMDLLPIVLTGVCRRVDRIRVSRVQDARRRRLPFQKKIGAGLTLKQFEKERRKGTLRHVGLAESMQMIAARMGWKLDRTEDILTPVVARKQIKTRHMVIKSGMATGVQQIGHGYVAGEERITLVFRASIGEPRPHDSVEIRGDPGIVSTIKGGVNGDIATCAIVSNAAKQVLHLAPGLRTMADVPVISCS